MKIMRVIVCALFCVAFYATAAGNSDFQGFTVDMTREQGDAQAKKQGFEVRELDANTLVYAGKAFGLTDRVLNARYENGKLAEISVYMWGKSSGPTGLSDKALEAKGIELLAAFDKKYGAHASKLNEATDNTTHTWILSDKSTLLLVLGPDYDRSVTIDYGK
ncbi:hypothetical protein [Budvicia diplopodorum]|uniref:hypothetical protein n=1 Tax=Budvicia diplopodorum TaxID=1119056 RepID=UPI0013583AF0|nr:hypothetical protein [Budvicia diplopodorum]